MHYYSSKPVCQILEKNGLGDIRAADEVVLFDFYLQYLLTGCLKQVLIANHYYCFNHTV